MATLYYTAEPQRESLACGSRGEKPKPVPPVTQFFPRIALTPMAVRLKRLSRKRSRG